MSVPFSPNSCQKSYRYRTICISNYRIFFRPKAGDLFRKKEKNIYIATEKNFTTLLRFADFNM